MCKTFEIILENRNENAHRIFGIENSKDAGKLIL